MVAENECGEMLVDPLRDGRGFRGGQLLDIAHRWSTALEWLVMVPKQQIRLAV